MDDFVTLTQLIQKDTVSIQALTLAIRKHGIYTFDQVHRPCTALSHSVRVECRVRLLKGSVPFI
jgi:hypothetical protein